MKSKATLLIATFLALVTLLTGCGGGSGTDSGTATNATPNTTPTPANNPSQPIQLAPQVASASTGATIVFKALNAVGTASFTLTANNSGGSVNASGLYTAGPTTGVTDIVTVTDSNNNQVAASILVGPVVQITPVAPTTTANSQINFSASGGSGTGYGFGLFRNQSSAGLNGSLYTAGTSNALDILAVSDSASNVNFAYISVSPSASITGPGFATTPRGTIDLDNIGGTGTIYWLLASNLSGATINEVTGVYTAGPRGGVTDVVMLADSAGDFAVQPITVSASIALTPANAAVAFNNTQQFTATGGSNTGYTFSITTNVSGGSITAGGLYTAGAAAGTDVVTVRDSLGNTTSVNVTVIAP